MNSISAYLISGVTSNTTGDFLPVKGMTNFTYTVNGIATGTMPPTGKIDVQIRLDGEDNWFTIFNNTYNGASGMSFQYAGPIKDTRAALSSRTAGSYDVICMYDNITPKVISFNLSGIDGGGF